MSKFTLISPRNISPKGTKPRIHMPLGAIAVLSEAKTANFDVELFDTSIGYINTDKPEDYFKDNTTEVIYDGITYWRTGLSDIEIVEHIKETEPDILGISCCTVVDREDTKVIAGLIADNFPEIPLIIGGHEISHHYEDILLGSIERNRIRGVSCICLGLGQANIVDVLNYILDGADTNKELPSGIAILRNNSMVVTELAEIDINEHALFDYSLVKSVHVNGREKPLDVYSYIGNTHAGNFKSLTKSINKNLSYYPIFTSYGCGNYCTFCDTDQYLLRYDIDNVIKMIEQYEELFGIDYIDFMDNNFAGGGIESRRVCFEILDYIHTKGYPIGFSNGLTFESMARNDFELLKTFEDYGNVIHIAFPCENGNDRVLRMIRKPHNLDMVMKVLQFAKEHLTSTNREGFFIGGFPDTLGMEAETPDEVNNTVEFIRYLIHNRYLEQAIFLKLSPVTSIYRDMWEERHPQSSFVHCLFSKGTEIWPYDSAILEDARLEVNRINEQSSRTITRKL